MRTTCLRLIRPLLLGAGLTTFVLPAPAAEPAASTGKIRIVLVGDSTVTDKDGWGAGFSRHVTDAATVINTSAGGRSSKSFRDEGRWDRALALRGDYYLIQFGHNDEKPAPELHTDPETTFAANLARYVDEVRAIGGRPVLVTSLTRRVWDAKQPRRIRSTLWPYVEATKKVATEKKVPVIDLHGLSLAYCEKIGPAETDKLNPLTASGNQDRTHLGPDGSLAFARILVVALRRTVPELRPALRDEPAPETTPAK